GRSAPESRPRGTSLRRTTPRAATSATTWTWPISRRWPASRRSSPGCTDGNTDHHAPRGEQGPGLDTGQADPCPVAPARHRGRAGGGGVKGAHERVLLPAGVRGRRGRVLPLLRRGRGLPRRRPVAVHGRDPPAPPA